MKQKVLGFLLILALASIAAAGTIIRNRSLELKWEASCDDGSYLLTDSPLALHSWVVSNVINENAPCQVATIQKIWY